MWNYVYPSYELYHHGIAGQKWGKKNGPPYPLAASAHSASEKKAGWMKSLKQKIEAKRLDKMVLSESALRLKKNADRGNKLARDLYGIKTIDENTDLMPKGSEFDRVAGDEKVDSNRKYVSLLRSYDSWDYDRMIPQLPIKGDIVYKYTYEAKKDLKIASEKQVSDYIVEHYGDTQIKDLSLNNMLVKKFNKKGIQIASKMLNKMKNVEVKDLYSNKDKYDVVARSYLGSNYKDKKMVSKSVLAHESFKSLFHHHLVTMPENRDAILKEFKKRGYDAIIDVEDKVAGYDYPLIVLDPKKSLKITSKIPYKDYEKKQIDLYKSGGVEAIQGSKYTKSIINKIRSLNRTGDTYAEIAEKLGISQSTVYYVLK